MDPHAFDQSLHNDLNNWNDALKNETKTAIRWQQVTDFITESLIQLICSNGWFIHKRNNAVFE